jgi:hypothetical protein
MNTNIKRGIVTGALSLSLLGGSVAGVAAQTQGNQANQGGAAGLVAAVVQANVDEAVNVIVADSFNNLRALNNVLNNSPILSNNDVDVIVTDVIDVGDVTVDIEEVLTDVQVNALNVFLTNNDIELEDITGIAVLSNGDLVVLS